MQIDTSHQLSQLHGSPAKAKAKLRTLLVVTGAHVGRLDQLLHRRFALFDAFHALIGPFLEKVVCHRRGWTPRLRCASATDELHHGLAVLPTHSSR